MIVREPPYDLVALFSDSEMQKLFEALIERGQAARDCTRPFRWRSIAIHAGILSGASRIGP